MERPGDKALQYRPLYEGQGWDLSRQDVGVYQGDLAQIGYKLAKELGPGNSFAGKFVIDFTLGGLEIDAVDTLFAWLDQYPNLHIILAENFIGWEDLKTKMQDLGQVRLFMDGRISLASSETLRMLESVLRQELVSEEKLAIASGKVAAVADPNSTLQTWQTVESFSIENDVGDAVEAYYAGLGSEALEVPWFKTIFGPDGKHSFSFDSMYEVGDKILLLVDCKHHFQLQDVDDLISKREKVRIHLQNIRDDSAPKGKKNYQQQLKSLKPYIHHELRLCCGGTYFDEDATAAAVNHGCLIVKPSGDRFQVIG